MRAKQTSRMVRRVRRHRLALALVAAMAAPAALAQSLPTGGSVVNGSAGIAETGSTMTITQTTRGAIINWGTFNIGAGYGVTFNQPNNGVTLNRVLGTLASDINGSLAANGNVFIINTNGITFGNNAQVNVGGLVASTLAMSDAAFLAGLSTGSYQFSGATGTPVVENFGDINVGAGGLGFVGPVLSNSGAIVANGGNIGFGAGTAVTLDFVGDGLTQVTVNAAAVDSGIVQDDFGSMTADGQSILLRAAATAGGSGGAIYAGGTLRAQTIANVNGRIELTSTGGPVMVGAPGLFSDASTLFTKGIIDVSGGSGETGGSVLVQGSDVWLVNEDSSGPILFLLPTATGSWIDATGGSGGGTVDIQASGGFQMLPNAGIDASSTGSGNGGTVNISADTIAMDAGAAIGADAPAGTGGTINLQAGGGLLAYGLLTAHGGNAGGGITTSSGGDFDIRGLQVDAGSSGAAGTWTLWAPNIDVVSGFDAGTVSTAVAGQDVQDAEINYALATGTNVTLRAGVSPSDFGDIYFNDGVDIFYDDGSVPLMFRADAQGSIYGGNFSIGSNAAPLSMAFNADANNLNNGFGYIDFFNATLDSSGGDILFYGQSDTANGVASSYATGVRLFDSAITTAGGNVLIRGDSTSGDAGSDDAGVVLDGTNISTAGGSIAIVGTGEDVTGGIGLVASMLDSGGGNIDLDGLTTGSGSTGVSLTDSQLIGGAGDVRVLGNAVAGIGVSFIGQSGISTTTGAIGVTGIGLDVGLMLTGGELTTDSGHFDLRGLGTGAASSGLVIGQGISIATNGGGIELAGEGGSGAGVELQGGSSIDAGNSLVVVRAGNDGSSDAIRIAGTITSGTAVNLRPGGVDGTGGLTERVDDTIQVGGGTTGFALSGAELAMIDAPQLIIGSNLHAGAIQVLGATTRNGNLTLQNDGGSGGIDIQAAIDVGNGTLALSSGGDISQTAAGAITAHSLLASAGGSVLLANANNNVAATTLAGSAGGDFEFQDVDALAIGTVSASGFDASANGLSSLAANGISAGGNVFVQNLAGDMILNAGVSGTNIDLVTANTLQNLAGASLVASGDWRVWANTWIGETRGGLAGDGNLPNLYGCTFLGQCAVTVPSVDNHFIYVQQPTAVITFDSFTREYGLPNPVFTFTVNGAILGDSAANVATGAGTTTATIGSNVGNYAITGNFTSAAGYLFQYVPGNLAITPATLLFTADQFVRYLGTANPLFTGTISGFRNGDTVQSVFGSGVVWTSPAGILSPIGFYPINGGTSATNYVFSQAPGNATALQIIPLPQLSSTPIDLIRETVNTYVYDRNFGGAPMCAVNASLDDQQLASFGDELSNEWSKVRSRPNLTNCFDSERRNSCGDF